MDKEILAEQNTDPGTLPVSSTPVPPLNAEDDRPMATISVGRGGICVGIDYIYASMASPTGESPVHEASGPPEHVNSAHEEPTSPPPAQDIALEKSIQPSSSPHNWQFRPQIRHAGAQTPTPVLRPSELSTIRLSELMT